MGLRRWNSILQLPNKTLTYALRLPAAPFFCCSLLLRWFYATSLGLIFFSRRINLKSAVNCFSKFILTYDNVHTA